VVHVRGSLSTDSSASVVHRIRRIHTGNAFPSTRFFGFWRLHVNTSRNCRSRFGVIRNKVYIRYALVPKQVGKKVARRNRMDRNLCRTHFTITRSCSLIGFNMVVYGTFALVISPFLATHVLKSTEHSLTPFFSSPKINGTGE